MSICIKLSKTITAIYSQQLQLTLLQPLDLKKIKKKKKYCLTEVNKFN